MPRAFSTATSLGLKVLAQNYTAEDIARLTGIHNRTLSNYLAGRVRILDHHLCQLADVLECEPEDLLDED